jgi:hypothetical protein
MAETTKIDSKQSRKRRIQLRFDVGTTPPHCRRLLIAGVAVCHGVQVLMHESHQLRKEDDDEDIGP